MKPITNSVFRHARVFLMVAEEGQIRRAAERLRIDASAISRRINVLESDLGLKLFVRSQTGLKLTPKGQKLADDLRRAMFDLESTIEDLKNTGNSQSGAIRIGVAEDVIRMTAFPSILAAFKSNWPAVDVELVPQVSAQQMASLKAGDIDVSLSRENVEHGSDLDRWPIAEFPLRLAVPLGHALANRSDLTIADLADQPLLWPDPDVAPKIAASLETAFRQAGIRPRKLMESGTTESVIAMVGAGQAIGFVNAFFCGNQPSLVLKSISDLMLPIVIELVWRRADRSVVLQNFIDAAKQQTGDRRTSGSA